MRSRELATKCRCYYMLPDMTQMLHRAKLCITTTVHSSITSVNNSQPRALEPFVLEGELSLTNAFEETQSPLPVHNLHDQKTDKGLAGTVTTSASATAHEQQSKRNHDALLVKEGRSYAQLAHPPPPGGRVQKNGTEQKIIVRVALSGALHRKAHLTRSGKQSRSLKPAMHNKPQPQVRQRLLNVERHVTLIQIYSAATYLKLTAQPASMQSQSGTPRRISHAARLSK